MQRLGSDAPSVTGQVFLSVFAVHTQMQCLTFLPVCNVTAGVLLTLPAKPAPLQHTVMEWELLLKTPVGSTVGFCKFSLVLVNAAMASMGICKQC